MSVISKILNLFIKTDKGVIIGELNRNDLCYCNSGIKFKKCHASELQKKKLTAYIIMDSVSKKKFIKVMKTQNKSTIRMKSNLRWEDIGGGRMGEIDPLL